MAAVRAIGQLRRLVRHGHRCLLARRRHRRRIVVPGIGHRGRHRWIAVHPLRAAHVGGSSEREQQDADRGPNERRSLRRWRGTKLVARAHAITLAGAVDACQRPRARGPRLLSASHRHAAVRASAAVASGPASVEPARPSAAPSVVPVPAWAGPSAAPASAVASGQPPAARPSAGPSAGHRDEPSAAAPSVAGPWRRSPCRARPPAPRWPAVRAQAREEEALDEPDRESPRPTVAGTTDRCQRRSLARPRPSARTASQRPLEAGSARPRRRP